MAKTLTGTVSSDAADKTITVTVTSRETHSLYGKQYTVSRKYMAHDEDNAAKIGDKVIISAARKVSKKKSFVLDSIIERSRGVIELKEEEVKAEVTPPEPIEKASSDDDEKSSKTLKKAQVSK